MRYFLKYLFFNLIFSKYERALIVGCLFNSVGSEKYMYLNTEERKIDAEELAIQLNEIADLH